jgi:hypothetical protein
MIMINSVSNLLKKRTNKQLPVKHRPLNSLVHLHDHDTSSTSMASFSELFEETSSIRGSSSPRRSKGSLSSEDKKSIPLLPTTLEIDDDQCIPTEELHKTSSDEPAESLSATETTQDDGHPETKEEKTVRFSTIEIREYGMCMGDNPSVGRGVPITIEWDHSEEILEFPVEDYDDARQLNRRLTTQLRIPPLVRRDLLLGSGYSRQEILEGAWKAEMARTRRQRTIQTLGWAPAEEFLERVRRFVSKILRMPRAKRGERR